MRNLKRVLSLTLASVMLLGMMVLGTSAAGYPDVDENDNIEAIDVLQAVGIMEGDPDGSFRPDDPVNRAEMAKIMCLLMNLNTYITGSNPFNDVPGWAEPYVGACYANGIIKGYGDGRFGASDNVTAVQAASMLMRALGYFQSPADEADGGWELSTIRQAGRIDLYNKVGSTTASEYLTRNQVAQIVLNTLKSGTVEPNNSNRVNVTVGDAQVAVGASNYEFIVGSDASVKYDTAISSQTARNSNGVSRPIIELGEKLYQGDLQYNDNTRDDFGRPSVRWQYKTKEIGVYVKDTTVYKNWTAKVAKNELYSLLGSSNASDLLSTNPSGTLRVWVDGVEQRPVTASDYLDRDNTGAIGGKNADDIQLGAGKGVLTEVFQDNDNNVTIAFTGTYVMQATADYSTSDNSVRVAVLTRPLVGNFVNENVLKAENFDGLADLGIKADDYLLYTCANGVVETVQKANVVVGEVTAYTLSTDSDYGKGGGSVSIDGSKHDYAKYAKDGAEYGYLVEYKVGANASVVLDAYDYAIYVDDSSLSVGNYVYIYQMAAKSGVGNKVEADAFFTDGTRQTITVKELKGRDGDGKFTANLVNASDFLTPLNAKDTIASSGVQVGGWYAYSVNSSNEYTLEKAKTTEAFEQGSTGVDDSLNIVNGRVSVGLKHNSSDDDSDIKSVTGNSNTIFVVLGKNNKVTVYTGVANVPDITGANGYGSWYLRTKDQDKKPAIAVFVDATGAAVRNGNATLLYILKEASRGRTNNSSTRAVNDSGMTYTYDVLIINDEKTEKSQITTTNELTPRTVYVSYGVDADGYYELETVDEMKDNYTYDPKGDDVILTVDAQEMNYANNTFTWGDAKEGYPVEFYMNANSAKGTILLLYPNEKGVSGKAGSDLLKSAIIKTGDSYKQYEGVDGKYIADMFKDYYVSGFVYAVRDDDVIKSMIIEVDGIKAKSSSGAGSSNPSSGASGTQVSGSVTVSELNKLLKDGNVIVTSNFKAADSSDTVIVPDGRTLTFKKDATFTSSYKLDLRGNATVNVDGTLKLAQDLPEGTTVHAGTMTVENDDSNAYEFGGTVTVDGVLTVGADETITVSGTMTVGSESGSGDVVKSDSGSYIIVTSTSSLHVKGNVNANVGITVGDKSNANNNGRVEIKGEMKGTFKDLNVFKSASAVPTQAITTITGPIVLNTGSKLTTTEFKPSHITITEAQTSGGAVATGAQITLEEGTKDNSNVGFVDEKGVGVGETTTSTTIVVGATDADGIDPEAEDLITTGSVAADTSPLFTAKTAIVYDAKTWEAAIAAGFEPIASASNYNTWEKFAAKEDFEHAVTTMPWLLVRIEANKKIPGGAVITPTVKLGSTTITQRKAGAEDVEKLTLDENGWAAKAAETFHWEMNPSTNANVRNLNTESTGIDGTWTVEFTVKDSAGNALCDPITSTALSTGSNKYTSPQILRAYDTDSTGKKGSQIVTITGNTIKVDAAMELKKLSSDGKATEAGADAGFKVPWPADATTTGEKTLAEIMGSNCARAIVLEVDSAGTPYGDLAVGFPSNPTSFTDDFFFAKDGKSYIVIGVKSDSGSTLNIRLAGKPESRSFSSDGSYQEYGFTITWANSVKDKLDSDGKLQTT